MYFKDNVRFFLNQNRLNEEDDTEETEAAVKTKKEKVCPKCGKEPCSCDTNNSVSTKTAGGDDDNDGYSAKKDKESKAAVETPKSSCSIDEIKDLIKKGVLKVERKGILAGELTPEEEEILKLFGIKASVADDHTNGRNGSVDTKVCPKCGKEPCECKKSLKESMLSLI